MCTKGLTDKSGYDLSMGKVFKVIPLLLLVLLTSSCASSAESEVNSQTGMVEFLCPTFKDYFEKANDEVWALTEFKTSVQSAQEAVIDVMSDAATISVVTSEPATSWLKGIGANGTDFLNYLNSSRAGSTEELIQIYGRWKANYESLNTYCP
jgi:hypothetical protein